MLGRLIRRRQLRKQRSAAKNNAAETLPAGRQAAAALALFLAAYAGEAPPKKEFAHFFGSNKELPKEADVLRAAKSREKKIYVLDSLRKLKEALARGPALVHWFDPELGVERYTVFYALQDDLLFLIDPFWGKRRVPEIVFARNWALGSQKRNWALAAKKAQEEK
jgi:hypothetical protein